MLKTIVKDRGTGKTTMAIGMLEMDENAILLVWAYNLKLLLPKKIQSRVFTISELLGDNLRGFRFSKIIFDEGFMNNKEQIAHVYYKLGKMQADVISIGSLDGTNLKWNEVEDVLLKKNVKYFWSDAQI